MTLKAQIVILIVLVLILIAIVNMVRQRKLDLKYVLVWLACDIVLIIFTCFPVIIDKIAALLGIYSPVNMVFFLGFVFSLIIIFSLTTAVSKMSQEIRRMAQKMALETDKNKED